jgi:Peroxisomal biogenesis factor 11 (PEX11)
MLTIIKAFMDLTVGVGLLKVAPKVTTPRVIGVLGLLSSLISCYKVLPYFLHISFKKQRESSGILI